MSAQGLTAEDVVAAERDSSETLSEEKLKARVVELAMAIVTTHRHMTEKLGQEMVVTEQELQESSAQREELAHKNLNQEYDLVDQAKAAKLTEIYNARTEEAKAQLMKKSQDVTEVLLESERNVAALRDAVFVQDQALDLNSRLTSLDAPVDDIRSLDERGISYKQRAAATVVASAAAVASTHGAVPSDDLTASDIFASRLLRALPEETARRGKVQAVDELRKDFDSQLHGMVAAAFSLPYGGFLSWAMSTAVGRTFASIYIVRGGSASGGVPPGVGENDVVRRNLGALSRAARHLERGELSGAVGELDAELTGLCRGRAAAWMQEARHALLVQQAARALQARARCLNATLL